MIAAETQYRDWMVAALAGDGAAYRRLLAALTGHLRAYFSRRAGPATRSGYVRAYWIGKRMSGGDNWARTEPSLNSTNEWMTDSG